MPASIEWMYSLPDIVDIRQAISSLQQNQSPSVNILSKRDFEPRTIAVIAGSFNPLTDAHIYLSKVSREHLRAAMSFFAMSTATVNKERVQRASLDDRLLVLKNYTRNAADLGVMATNRGLYADQAQALHRLYTNIQKLYFIIGFDKAPQIFDPKYYQNRDEALHLLFSFADLAVVPRKQGDEQELSKLLNQPQNKAFARYIHLLPCDPHFLGISSSEIRQRYQAGDRPDFLPSISHQFIEETRVYSLPEVYENESIDHYGIRLQLIAMICKNAHLKADINFYRLYERCVEESLEGAKLRALLKGRAPLDKLLT